MDSTTAGVGDSLRPVAARSRSRSRQRSSNPSELLQRKLQMQQANANQSSLLGSMSLAADGELEFSPPSSLRSSRSNDRKRQNDQQQQQQQHASGPAQDRLADLSEQLRNHQASHELQQVTGAGSSIEDVYILLAKKDKDLQLAAELGKVLLEKNEELSKTNERITEDYSRQLEVSCVALRNTNV